MTILPWRKPVALAVADEHIKAQVARALKLDEQYRRYDYRKGYRAGIADGFMIGCAVSSVLAMVVLFVAQWLAK